MAKSKEMTKKNSKKRSLSGFLKNVATFFKDVIRELKRVTWPSRKDLISYSVAVVVFVAVFAVVIFVMDIGLSRVTDFLLG